MPAGRKLADYLREGWPRLVLELLVLIIGISLSLMIDGWRTGLEHRQTERRTLAAIRENLASDTLVIGRQSTRLRDMIHAYDQLLKPGAADSLPPDSVDRYMDLAISYVAFSRNDNAYEEMRQTGSSAFVRDKALLNEIINLYNREYFRAQEWDGIDRNFVLNRMIPYVDDNAPYFPVGSRDGVLIGTTPAFRVLVQQDRFKNLLKTNRLFKEAHVTVYGLTRARIDSLLVELDRTLGKE